MIPDDLRLFFNIPLKTYLYGSNNLYAFREQPIKYKCLHMKYLPIIQNQSSSQTSYLLVL